MRMTLCHGEMKNRPETFMNICWTIIRIKRIRRTGFKKLLDEIPIASNNFIGYNDAMPFTDENQYRAYIQL